VLRLEVYCSLALAVALSASQAVCADLPSPDAQFPVSQPSVPDALLRPDSIFVFGGALSTGALKDTLQFNQNPSAGRIPYDNFIAGVSYNHNFYYLGYGFALGAEIGVADRFGHYGLCCDTVIKSSGMLHSGELWVGPRFSFDGVALFDTIKIGAAVTAGFSFTTNSIGRERQSEVAWNGNARVLLYLGPEISLAFVNHPEWEFVYSLHHRSGANGVFGRIREGYNANIAGVRYKF
jgi:hypothetical protein